MLLFIFTLLYLILCTPLISGIIVLFLGETLSYIDKRDFLSFLIRLVLLLVLPHISFYLGLKVIEKINSEISKEDATK